MCAINGITWEDSALVEQMNHATAHRGPDGTAVAVYRGVTLGHNRLAIIDLDPRAGQPMSSRSERYSIIFNGEIYNFKDVREALRGSYQFKTESDTEVVLAGFEVWGAGIFERLNGMYALAIHDRDTGTIVLARDPVGVKPLYITKTTKGYAFSSEIKALLEVGMPRVLNTQAFASYMRTLYVPSPATLLQGIEKFPAGTIGTIKDGSISLERFSYRPQHEPLARGDTQGLRSAVMSAVSRQMVSDRPLGVYLSGGVDSSVVLASATAAGGNADTFSIGFELERGEEAEKFNADSIIAKRTAAHFGARHHEFAISPPDVLGLLEKASYHLDEPIGNATIAAQVALSEKARASAVVALTGDGGDEVFGGYPRYLLTRRMDLYQALVPSAVARRLPFSAAKKIAVKALEERFALFHFQKNAELERVLNVPVPMPALPQIAPAENLMEADRVTWLVDEALMRSDKLGMAHGLETRPPLLDLELLHQVSAIPFEAHVSLFTTKVLLKRAFQKDLPAWVVNQPKRGWFSPGAKWLRHPALAEPLDAIFAPEYAPGTERLFDWDGVRAMLSDHQAKRSYHATPLLSILMFQLWSRRFNASL